VGGFSWLDERALHDWMPGLDPSLTSTSTVTGSLFPFIHPIRDHRPGLDIANDLVTLPGYALVSVVLVGLGCAVLLHRGQTRGAVAWLIVFGAANVVEVASKATLVRPALHASTAAGEVHFAPFDSSFPSGHALRCFLVGALLVRLWSRSWPAVAVWLVAVGAVLVAAGVHTPSDVLGGLVLGGFAVSLARPVECFLGHVARGQGLRRPRPSKREPQRHQG
jgi:membrane-associated phospholipid phosphatase